MGAERDTAATEHGEVAEARLAAPDAPIASAADPAAILARVANDRAHPSRVVAVGALAGNRFVQRVAKQQVARTPTVAQETGTYLDPYTDPAYAKMLPLLKRSPWGRDALAVMTKYQVRTYLASDGPPANFAQELNRVRLNTSLRDDVVSAYYVHEMYHASQFHEGKPPGPSSHDDKGKWVRMLVDEEIEGTALGYLHKLQIERTEPKAPADDKPPHMNYFRNAFDAGFKDAKAAGKGLDAARADGRARGRRMAEYLIRPTGGDRHRLGVGEWSSYTEYYEREWERAPHPKPADSEPAPVP